MPLLKNPSHEAFAQARFAGQTIPEACASAGLSANDESASALIRAHDVRERIAELHRESSCQTPYEKIDAVRDLLTIIHSSPSDAGDDQPLCEVRIGRDGPSHRFPPKLRAMARLMKFMGWDPPLEVHVELKDNFIELMASIRTRNATKLKIAAGSVPLDATAPSQLPPGATAGQKKAHQSSITQRAILEFEEKVGYRKDDAVRDLMLMIHARPSAAGPHHPFCETRLTSWGVYYRFPSKLAALTLLARMLRWDGPTKPHIEHDPDAKFKQLAAFIRTRS